MSDILWLHKKSFSQAQMWMVTEACKQSKLDIAQIAFHSIEQYVPGMYVKKAKTKNKWIINEAKRSAFFTRLDFYIKNVRPKIIVINDVPTLEFITGYNSLDLCRGSVYMYKDIPCIVVDDILKTKNVKYYSWVVGQDLGKIRRWLANEKRAEPKFDYVVCDDYDSLSALMDLTYNESILIATDIETSHNFITCIGYSLLLVDGRIINYVVPFVDPTEEDGCYWKTEELEIRAWQTVRQVNSCQAFKTMQNGQYDSAYFIKFHIPTKNYLFDSLHLIHSIWPEIPKKLNFISSLVMDHCQYWKDESKGDKDKQNKNETVPQTKEGLQRYWRYNALDCWHTLIDTCFLLRFISKPPLDWARSNYATEFSLQVGPALAGSMRGLLVNKDRQRHKRNVAQKEANQMLHDLRIMCDDDEFNPNSPGQVKSLIYDVLGAKPVKQKGRKKGPEKGTGEKILENIRNTQHPIFGMYIDKILGSKKPMNNITKYGPSYKGEDGKWKGLYLLNNRWMYSLSAAGTETGRFSSKGHHYWVGNQVQNVPPEIRDQVVADKGYFFFEADYSQSDAYYVAHEAEDLKYIETMLSGMRGEKDTHCMHAEFFFKKPYDEIYEGYKAKEDWVVHSTKGVRQNTKRIVHGANFQMAGFTLYLQIMGHDATVESAKALGFKDAHTWPQARLVNFCQELLDAYHVLYPGLRPWFQRSLEEAIKSGNKATCAFGKTRLFFGNMATDKNIQRELSAFFGQGGTAGAINKTLNDYYYRSDLEKKGVMFQTQTHDSILWQVPISDAHLARNLLTLMKQPCIIKGRSFEVPIDAKCGFSWGDRCMIGYDEFLPDEKLVNKMIANENKWERDNYAKAA